MWNGMYSGPTTFHPTYQPIHSSYYSGISAGPTVTYHAVSYASPSVSQYTHLSTPITATPIYTASPLYSNVNSVYVATKRSTSVPSRRLSASTELPTVTQVAPPAVTTIRRGIGTTSSHVRSASAPHAPPPTETTTTPKVPVLRSWVASYGAPTPAAPLEVNSARTIRPLFPVPVPVPRSAGPAAAAPAPAAPRERLALSRVPDVASEAPLSARSTASSVGAPSPSDTGSSVSPLTAPDPAPRPLRNPSPATAAPGAAPQLRGRSLTTPDVPARARPSSMPAVHQRRLSSTDQVTQIYPVKEAAKASPAASGFVPSIIPFKPAPRDTVASDRIVWQDYIRIQQIGQGMSGQVWRTYHRSSRAFYALKVMQKETFKPHFMHHVLQMEMSLQGAIDHPFIVKVEHIYDAPEMVILVMPFLSNGDLTSAFRGRVNRPFGEAITRFWTAQVISALSYLHRHSIIYGDMKPDNVLLDERRNAHLTDFGLARWVPSGKHIGRRGFGMPNSYLSPEMIKGEPYGMEADLWATGILMYLMVQGRHPFIGPTDSITDCEGIHSRMIGPDVAEVAPGSMTAAGAGFFHKVLQKPMLARLTTAAQARAHPWLASLDWAALEAKSLPCPDPDAAL
eukprot:EG_transcript_6562